MQKFKQSESTAARAIRYFHLVDATDGMTPETGEAGGQPQIDKSGGGFNNTSATLTSLGYGSYYIILTATELNTLGFILVRYKSTNTAEFQDVAQVVAFDPFAVAGLGLTNLDAKVSDVKAVTDKFVFTIPNKVDATIQLASDFAQAAADKVWGTTVRTLSAAGVQAIWDALTTALTTTGSIGKKLADWVVGTIDTYTGNTKQTGDAYTKLPTSPAAVGSAMTLTSDYDAAKTAAQAGEAETAVATTARTEPAVVPAANASLRDKIGWLFMLARNKITQTSSAQKVRTDGDAADVGTSTFTDDGTTLTRGKFS